MVCLLLRGEVFIEKNLRDSPYIDRSCPGGPRDYHPALGSLWIYVLSGDGMELSRGPPFPVRSCFGGI